MGGCITKEVSIPLSKMTEDTMVCVNIRVGDDPIASVILYRGYSDTLSYEIIESANPDIRNVGDYPEYFDLDTIDGIDDDGGEL